MIPEEVDLAAAAVLECAIAAGRLPARPRLETLTLVAGIIRPALADAPKENDRRSKQPAVVMSGGRNGRDDHSE